MNSIKLRKKYKLYCMEKVLSDLNRYDTEIKDYVSGSFYRFYLGNTSTKKKTYYLGKAVFFLQIFVFILLKAFTS